MSIQKSGKINMILYKKIKRDIKDIDMQQILQSILEFQNKYNIKTSSNAFEIEQKIKDHDYCQFIETLKKEYLKKNLKLKKIYLEITNNCNLNCSFCIGNKRQKKEMSFDEFKLILKRIKTHTRYLYFHVLGEPLIHSSINEFINYAKEQGFFINITTNGYLINRIKDNKNIRQLNISLHSFIETPNLPLDKYLTNIFDAIDNLIENQTYISLRLWVNNKYNREMEEFINKRYNIDTNLEEYNKINEYLFINPFHEFIWPDLDNNYYNDIGTCYALKDHIGILSDGTVVPCCLDTKGDINLGNIFTENLEEILNTKRVKNMQKNFKNKIKCEELCKHCSFLKEED